MHFLTLFSDRLAEGVFFLEIFEKKVKKSEKKCSKNFQKKTCSAK